MMFKFLPLFVSVALAQWKAEEIHPPCQEVSWGDTDELRQENSDKYFCFEGFPYHSISP